MAPACKKFVAKVKKRLTDFHIYVSMGNREARISCPTPTATVGPWVAMIALGDTNVFCDDTA